MSDLPGTLVLTLAIDTDPGARRVVLALTRRQFPGRSIEVRDGKSGSLPTLVRARA